MKERAWWIRLPDGSRRRLSSGGVLLGRDPEADIVLVDPHASRKHALIYVSGEGPHVIGLGRGTTAVNGQPLVALATVKAGDVIEIPGLRLRVEAEDAVLVDAAEPSWVVEILGGNLFGVGPHGVSVGSGASDDVQIEPCPPRALHLRTVNERLILETYADVLLRDEVLPAGAMESLRSGDVLALGPVKLRVLARGGSSVASTVGTATAEDTAYPAAARLMFFPRGGRLTLDIRGKSYSTYLAERRCDLVACLLRPPAPFQAGDPVPAEVVMRRVWPTGSIGPSTLTVLVSRVRRDLVNAGIDGGEVLARAPGGGALRFSLRRGAVVEVF